MQLRAIGIAALLAVAGCQSAAGDEEIEILDIDAQGVAADAEAAACPDIGQKAYFFWMEPRSAEPGDKIALFPYWTDMPGAYNDLPPGCLQNLGVSPEGAATFTRQDDGLPIAEISPDVEAGTRMRLDATYNGHSLIGPVDVFRAADNPLVGTWRQDGEGCPADSAIQELVFTGGGDFSVTWTPFEVYKDYWGTYALDTETGAIRLDIEGGNQVPGDVVTEGTVSLSDNAMTFDALYFGTPVSAEGGCHAGFSQ
ncbi:MAG: hypothetical protein R3C13_13480 [Hyphomonas sp.]|uniref:hypothetical protein n=1 Tax=Hyphomonas sp. TaxID=87 RepID=UPI003527833C